MYVYTQTGPPGSHWINLCFSLLALLNCSFLSVINYLMTSSAASWPTASLLRAEASQTNFLQPSPCLWTWTQDTGWHSEKGWKVIHFWIWDQAWCLLQQCKREDNTSVYCISKTVARLKGWIKNSGKEWRDTDSIMSFQMTLNRNSYQLLPWGENLLPLKNVRWGRTKKITDSEGVEVHNTLGHVAGLFGQWWWIWLGSCCAGCTSGQTPNSSHKAKTRTLTGGAPLPSLSPLHYLSWVAAAASFFAIFLLQASATGNVPIEHQLHTWSDTGWENI